MAFCGCSPGVRRCHGDPRLCCKTPLGLRCLKLSNLGTIGVKPKGAGLCFYFAGSFQTGAPPTQGRAVAQSQLVATEKLHHAIIVALAPNAEFTIKMWVKMSLPGKDFRRKANPVCNRLKDPNGIVASDAHRSRHAAKSCPAGRTYWNSRPTEPAHAFTSVGASNSAAGADGLR
jgi:hypothetical protein